MAAGDDLFFRRSRRQFQNTDSGLRDERQERVELDFPVPERQVILRRPAAIMDVQAEEPVAAARQRLDVVVPAEEFLALRVAEVVPVADDVRRKRVEHLDELDLVGKFLEVLANLEAELDLQL